MLQGVEVVGGVGSPVLQFDPQDDLREQFFQSRLELGRHPGEQFQRALTAAVSEDDGEGLAEGACGQFALAVVGGDVLDEVVGVGEDVVGAPPAQRIDRADLAPPLFAQQQVRQCPGELACRLGRGVRCDGRQVVPLAPPGQVFDLVEERRLVHQLAAVQLGQHGGEPKDASGYVLTVARGEVLRRRKGMCKRSCLR